MSVNLFVTHGRGLDVFAQDEIREKIRNVKNVESLGEGKTSFVISLQDDNSSGAEEGKYKEEKLLNEVSTVFNLKLVERVFLLLYCENITADGASNVNRNSGESFSEHGDYKDSKNSILQEYTDKILQIIDSEKWLKTASQVQALTMLQDQQTIHVPCQNPSTCHGAVRRRAEYQKLQQKRILKAELSSSKRMKRSTDAEISDVKTLEVDSGNDNCINSGAKFLQREKIKSADRIYQTAAKTECFGNGSANDQSNISDIDNNKEMHTQEYILSNSEGRAHQDSQTSENHHNSLGNANRNCAVISDIESSVQSSDNNIFEKTLTFRVSSRVSGNHKKILTQHWLAQTFVECVSKQMKDWTTDWRKPLLDFYINITNTHFIVGVTLSKEPLSLRPYIPHITLRSTISYLMGKLAKIPEGGIVLDPMCGGGTILLEVAKSFKAGMIIGGDVNLQQLEISRCNLQATTMPCNLICMDATAIPLHSKSVSAIVCDIPFGQKHQIQMEDHLALLQGVLCECQRVLICNGRLVLLISARQHGQLKEVLSVQTKMCSQSQADNEVKECLQWKLEASYLVSLGETCAYVAVLLNASGKE